MSKMFSAAMRRATRLTGRGDLGAATRVIGQALQARTTALMKEAERNAAKAARKAAAKAKAEATRAAKSAATAAAKAAAARAKPAAAKAKAKQAGPVRKAAAKPARKAAARAAPAGRGLGEMVASLRQARAAFAAAMPTARPEPAAPEPLPAGAQFLSRDHAAPQGARSYRLYVPATAAPRGLVLMLHGCKQTPDDFAAGTGMNAVAEARGLVVAWPAQTGAHNMASCWNWFSPAHQARGAGEAAILADLAQSLAAEFGLDRDATFAAGLSAGGAMAAALGAAYPDVFAAVGVHSGLAAGAARDVPSALAAMRNGAKPAAAPKRRGAARVRTIVFHGDADATVHPSNAAHVAAAAGAPATAAAATRGGAEGGRPWVRSRHPGPDGRPAVEVWMVEGAGHAWAGGRPTGSYTDPRGPDASAEMARFFLAKPAAGGR